jgi:Bacterial Ig-like domain/Regulator of chromosome condensation (RCC1) repeat
LLLVAVERTDAQAQVEVWAWGDNAFGQLGDGTTPQRNTPTQLSGLSGVQTIAGGFYHSLALKSDGTVWAWGRNEYGQLGDGTTTQRNTPVQIRVLSGVQDIDGGGNHALAVTSADTMPPSPPTDPVPGPPTVESTIPTANETGVVRTIDIKATFSEDIEGDTITANNFKPFKKGSTTPLAATVSYPDPNSPLYTAKLDPTNSLRSGRTYKAVVTTGVKDSVGNSLAQQYKLFFTVS